MILSKRLRLSVTMALVAAAAAPVARADPLAVVEVSAPAVNCVFHANCIVTVSDTTGAVAMPFLDTPGTAWLQSRTFTGEAGTPGAGLTGYEYRLSLTEAAGFGDCLLGLVLNFGPITKLPYKSGSLADVYVVTGGGLGTIGLKSADQEGDVITFEFATPLCVSKSPSDSATTFFFGLASSKPPTAISATVYAFGNPPFYGVDARAPEH
jgi:hypothetical protein